jgi:DNA polymerase-3 subunit alpha (Gram-positive type)
MKDTEWRMRVTDSYVCIDLETTGLDPKRDKIIEIGAVKVEDGKITAQWESFVNPGRSLEERIVELTGICDEQLADAPQIGQVLPAFHDFTKDQVILGHSVLFDFSFLKKAAVDGRMKFERCGIDTLKIARKYLQELESRSLGSLCTYYGIPHSAHRALADAMATVALYDKLTDHFYEKEAKEGDKSLFLPKPLLYQAKRDTPLTIPQKEQLYKLTDKHKLILDYQIESLTRSEASRKIDQLLAEYGR